MRVCASPLRRAEQFLSPSASIVYSRARQFGRMAASSPIQRFASSGEMHDKRKRGGSAIIDALVALAILGASGLVLLGLLGQTAKTLRGARESERAVVGASEQLNWISVQSRMTLQAMLGRTTVHGWSFDVAAASATLFDISVAESDTTRVLLRTTLYRPDTS